MRRNFADVQRTVLQIAAVAPPQRSKDNLLITSRMVKLLGLEDAMNRLNFIHVAGSKGKGTTCAYCARFLEANGLKVGLFTSPHLYDVRERFLVNYAKIPEDRFTEYFFEVYDRQKTIEVSGESEFDRAASRAGFFRFTFYLALHAFAKEQVDVVVLETGLGGRIDATNIVSPKCTAITALGLEHTEILGNTIEEIALEKAGIMKPEVPCFVDPQTRYPAAAKVLSDEAQKVGAPILVINERNPVQWKLPPLAMEGQHIAQNCRLGLALSRFFLAQPFVLPLSPAEQEVCRTTEFEGRSQVIEWNEFTHFYIDGAHTPESCELAASWFKSIADRDLKRQNILLFYSQRDPEKILPSFKTLVPCLYSCLMCPVEFSRTTDADNIKKISATWEKLYGECGTLATYPKTAEEIVAVTHTDVHGQQDLSVPVNVFVTGSLYLVGTVLKALSNSRAAKPAAASSPPPQQ
jgi:folylpolyglutamate synthase